MNNIVLCGFMGCGKSTVGRELAKLLEYNFVDMDKYIEDKEKMTVSEIFTKNGESYFRKLETEVAIELSHKSNLVIGSGGGAVLNKSNVEAFKNGGIVVFINVPIKIIENRLKGDTTRPLLVSDKLETMRKLYSERIPIYNEVCDLKVLNDDNKEAKLVADEIIGIIKN